MSLASEDAEGQARLRASFRGCGSGLDDGRNLRIDTRWGAGDADRHRRYAAELVVLRRRSSLPPWRSCGAATAGDPHLPIVFVNVVDPVGAGFVESLSQPGGNVTGFTTFESGLAGNGWNC